MRSETCAVVRDKSVLAGESYGSFEVDLLCSPVGSSQTKSYLSEL